MNVRRLAAATVLAAVALTGCTSAAPEPAAAPAVTTPAAADDAAREPAEPSGPVVDVPVTGTSPEEVAAAAAVPPVSLDIPALGVVVPIDPVGVEADGQMEIPALAERAGWYRYGPSAGEPEGTTVVAAHVDSVASAGLGPFARLQELRVGDTVDVQLDDGSTQVYAVTGVLSLNKTAIPWAEYFTREGPHRLVLVTCGGAWEQAESSYSDNVIVTAEPVEA